MELILEHIPIDPERATRVTVELGEKAKGRLSPFDMPISLEMLYKEADSFFQGRFVYLTPNEPKRIIELADKNVHCEVGKFSNKLYAIKVFNVERDGLSGIPARLDGVLDALLRELDLKKPADQVPFMNFSFAKAFLAENRRLSMFGHFALS